jgi:SAM-dependent methyltransferase
VTIEVDGQARPFWEQDPTGRFSPRARDYARARPDYPREAVAAILDGLGPPAALVAADIGAGTGIASRLLADEGVNILAIEPNAAMRAAFTAHPRVVLRDATAEATGLPDAHVDLVVCAQAFHWFEPIAALREFRRILRPGGRLALMWNERDDRDAFTAAYTTLLRGAVGGDPTEARREGLGEHLAAARFGDVRDLAFAHRQGLTADALVARADSASYVPREGPARDALVAGLRDLHARFADADGRAWLVYETHVHRATG